ncbi:hypothetical protein C0991_011285, partial [Blastosporella zonata]
QTPRAHDRTATYPGLQMADGAAQTSSARVSAGLAYLACPPMPDADDPARCVTGARGGSPRSERGPRGGARGRKGFAAAADAADVEEGAGE